MHVASSRLAGLPCGTLFAGALDAYDALISNPVFQFPQSKRS